MKIFVFGDSIAYGKWDEAGGWVQRLRADIDKKHNLNNESENYQVFNLGIPGEIAVRLAERMESELTSRIFDEDNLVILAVGINDSCSNNWLSGKQTDEKVFKNAIKRLINIAQKHKCKVVGIGLSPIDSNKSKGLLFNNNDVAKYNLMLEKTYLKKNIPFLNMFDELQRTNFSDHLVDSVHPNSKGHALLFERIRDFLQENKLI